MNLFQKNMIGLLSINLLTILCVIFLKYKIIESKSIIDIFLTSIFIISGSILIGMYKQQKIK